MMNEIIRELTSMKNTNEDKENRSVEIMSCDV